MLDKINRYVESANDLYHSGAIRFEQICEEIIIAFEEDRIISNETGSLFQNILDFAQGKIEDEMVESKNYNCDRH